MDEAERAHEELEKLVEKNGDANLAVRGCLARATFYKDNLKDDARVARKGDAYLIDLQDSSNCTVRAIDASLIERYREGGSQAQAQPAAQANRAAARPAQGR
jgi:hypothetical protein